MCRGFIRLLSSGDCPRVEGDSKAGGPWLESGRARLMSPCGNPLSRRYTPDCKATRPFYKGGLPLIPLHPRAGLWCLGPESSEKGADASQFPRRSPTPLRWDAILPLFSPIALRALPTQSSTGNFLPFYQGCQTADKDP